jgi:TolA-binding protein
MSVVDLHPEDLIDKLAEGSITPAERERLDAHLAGCAACRLEYAARSDFESDVAKEVHARPSLLTPSTALKMGLPEVDPPARSAPRASVRGRAFRLALLAAAAVTVAGVAGASIWSRLPWVAREMPAATATPPVAPARTRVAHAHPPTAIETIAPPEEALAREPSIGEPAAPAARSAPRPGVFLTARPAPHSAPVHEPHAATAPSMSNVKPTAESTPAALPPAPEKTAVNEEATPPATSAAAAPAATPGTLFASANAARRRGDTARAIELYRDLQRRYPRSDEARISRATLARLLLDRGEPGAALSGFDQYLSNGRAVLEEEALVGRALALQSLGRRDDEIAAWNDVLRSYPSSIYSEHARARLAALTRH